jgi:hypothetical protein
LTFERLQDALGERSPLGVAGDIDAHVRAVVREMLAENATPAEKPEKPAVTTFDFGDGNGPVPAHKHSNGGGWVADTATVADTAYVGPNARVYGYARVYENAQVYGYARLFGSVRVTK